MALDAGMTVAELESFFFRVPYLDAIQHHTFFRKRNVPWWSLLNCLSRGFLADDRCIPVGGFVPTKCVKSLNT